MIMAEDDPEEIAEKTLQKIFQTKRLPKELKIKNVEWIDRDEDVEFHNVTVVGPEELIGRLEQADEEDFDL